MGAGRCGNIVKPAKLLTVFCVSRQGVESKGDTQLMKRFTKCFTLGAPYLPSQSLSDCVFYKADGNISATVTRAGDRISVWKRI